MSVIIQIIWKYFQENSGPQNNQFPLFVLTDDMHKKIFISLAKKQNKTLNCHIMIDLIKV